MITKATTLLILIFTAGAMIAHAWSQPAHNEASRIEASKRSEIVGWWKMGDVTKQLYYEVVE